MQSSDEKYLLPGMKPRARPIVSTMSHSPSPPPDDEDDEDMVAESKLVKRSSVRNLDHLRADPEMMQLLQTITAGNAVSSRQESFILPAKDLDNVNDQLEGKTSSLDPSVPHPPSKVNEFSIRLIQFVPEWSILLFIRFLDVEVVSIENSPFPNALGKSLPVLIHGRAVISGRYAILEYLNRFNHSSSFNFYYSPMACFIDINCYQSLHYLNHLHGDSRLQSSILIPWGLKWSYSWILEWWNRYLVTNPLLNGCREEDLLTRLEYAYHYLSNLIQPTSRQSHLKDSVNQNDDDCLQLADILLFGHIAEVLLHSNENISKLVHKFPLLVDAFNADCMKFFSGERKVNYL